MMAFMNYSDYAEVMNSLALNGSCIRVRYQALFSRIFHFDAVNKTTDQLPEWFQFVEVFNMKLFRLLFHIFRACILLSQLAVAVRAKACCS